jgi:ParB-like chromosome segregation protein Spo0J
MEDVRIKIEEIYVPAKWRTTIEPAKVESLAESILENGQQSPISVRKGNNRFVLVSGVHRLEAMKALGEDSIAAVVVGSPQH